MGEKAARVTIMGFMDAGFQTTMYGPLPCLGAAVGSESEG